MSTATVGQGTDSAEEGLHKFSPQSVEYLDELIATATYIRRVGAPAQVLQQIGDLSLIAHSVTHAMVRDARQAGVRWADIGKVFDVTAQGAQQRFRQDPLP